MDGILDAVSAVVEVIWGVPLFIIVAGIGLFFTIKLKFFQVTKIGYIFRNTIGTLFGKNKKDTSGEGSLKSLQVAMTVLSGTMGAGSIAGVATAIAIGGPGAVFWMWLTALLGMLTKMAEVTLGLYYRRKGDNGEYYGGPMFYIRRGLGSKWAPLATVYAIALFILVITDAGFVQTNTMASVLNDRFNIPVMVTGVFIVIVGAFLVFKGVKALGAFATYVLPVIALMYIIGALWVTIAHITAVPQAIADIFYYAFAPHPAVGGFVGSTIMLAMSKGISRGIFANEAGMGTSATVHATADVDHPVRQGMWGTLEVFFVSFITCSVTAFAVLTSGLWSTSQYEGINIAFAALDTSWHPVLVAILSFGTSLIMFTSYLGSFLRFRATLDYLFKEKAEKWLKWLFFIPPLIAVNMEVPWIWLMADAAVGLLVIPNVIALFMLRKVFFKLYKDWRSRDKLPSDAVQTNPWVELDGKQGILTAKDLA
jgi:AGCS family alanine or glycine:cation symporter